MVKIISFATIIMILAQYYFVVKVNARLDRLENLMRMIRADLTIPKEEEKEKKPAANRKPRTEAQKRQASLQRKEWWEKKKASEKQIKLTDTSEAKHLAS